LTATLVKEKNGLWIPLPLDWPIVQFRESLHRQWPYQHQHVHVHVHGGYDEHQVS
jgi:hypothetical protein